MQGVWEAEDGSRDLRESMTPPDGTLYYGDNLDVLREKVMERNLPLV